MSIAHQLIAARQGSERLATILAIFDLVQANRVYPSEDCCSTLLMATRPPAPGLFSTTKVASVYLAATSVNLRAVKSISPPGPV